MNARATRALVARPEMVEAGCSPTRRLTVVRARLCRHAAHRSRIHQHPVTRACMQASIRRRSRPRHTNLEDDGSLLAKHVPRVLMLAPAAMQCGVCNATDGTIGAKADTCNPMSRANMASSVHAATAGDARHVQSMRSVEQEKSERQHMAYGRFLSMCDGIAHLDVKAGPFRPRAHEASTRTALSFRVPRLPLQTPPGPVKAAQTRHLRPLVWCDALASTSHRGSLQSCGRYERCVLLRRLLQGHEGSRTSARKKLRSGATLANPQAHRDPSTQRPKRVRNAGRIHS